MKRHRHPAASDGRGGLRAKHFLQTHSERRRDRVSVIHRNSRPAWHYDMGRGQRSERGPLLPRQAA